MIGSSAASHLLALPRSNMPPFLNSFVPRRYT